MDAVAMLVELLDRPKPMPVLHDRVRVDKQDAERLIERILRGAQGADGASADISEAALSVREELRDAKPVPLTYQVRLRTAACRDLADLMRRAAQNASS
jgi:hypothetical protein